VLLASVEPALSQSLGGAPDDGISLWRVGGALLFCLGLGVAGAFLLKSRSGGNSLFHILHRPQRRLAVVETLRIPPASTLAIVSCDEQEFLILSSSGTASLVDRLPQRDGDPAETPPT
jgi:hypothetical protein